MRCKSLKSESCSVLVEFLRFLNYPALVYKSSFFKKTVKLDGYRECS